MLEPRVSYLLPFLGLYWSFAKSTAFLLPDDWKETLDARWALKQCASVESTRFFCFLCLLSPLAPSTIYKPSGIVNVWLTPNMSHHVHRGHKCPGRTQPISISHSTQRAWSKRQLSLHFSQIWGGIRLTCLRILFAQQDINCLPFLGIIEFTLSVATQEYNDKSKTKYLSCPIALHRYSISRYCLMHLIILQHCGTAMPGRFWNSSN